MQVYTKETRSLMPFLTDLKENQTPRNMFSHFLSVTNQLLLLPAGTMGDSTAQAQGTTQDIVLFGVWS